MQNNEFLELLSLAKPGALIRTIEKGLEVEQLLLVANPDSTELKESIHYSTIILTFLHLQRLGRRD